MTSADAAPEAISPGASEPSLIIAECFGVEQPTFQGEGPSCGHPALFIRLSRCNLTCRRCDTKHSWDWSQFDPREESTKQPVAQVLAWALSSPVELVVITGGEPLLQQKRLIPLVHGLLAAGKRVEVETNGTLEPDPGLLVNDVRFNVSPKIASFGISTDKSLVPAALKAFAACERAVFKFVARTVADLDEIAVLVDQYGLAPVWVMPEGATTQALLDSTRVLADAVAARRWCFTTRLHVLAFEDARGR
ncbi:7-carboxy-7-deazaguanine synthase QueE [Streptomyces sp. NPDC054861]